MVSSWVVAEGHMVDRDAKVEAALFVRVDDLVGCVRRDVVADIAECAAVAHSEHCGPGAASKWNPPHPPERYSRCRCARVPVVRVASLGLLN
jgi:hypothetical protein